MEPISPLIPLLKPLLSRGSGLPLHRCLTDGLRGAMLDGRLRPGHRLPPSRTLARGLGIGRNTVIAAYDQLTEEGFLEARVGAGTFVSVRLPGPVIRGPGVRGSGVREATVAGEGKGTAAACPLPPPSRLARRLLDGTPRVGWSRDAVPLRSAMPALETFPWDAWARCLSRAWRQPGDLASLAPPTGLPALQQEIAAFLAETRAVACAPDQIFVVNGAQQALALAARLLLDEGDHVLVEDPGFPGVDAALAAAGAHAHPVPVDGKGVVLPPVLPEIRAILVTPSRAFPLGTTMSLPRRLSVLEAAARANAWIIEDDYDSDVRFDGRPEPALQGLEAAAGVPESQRRVLYAGTFVRALFPSLRLGYLIVPAPLVAAARGLRLAMDGGASAVTQAALAAFMAEGHLTSHLRAMRPLYDARREALASALRRRLGDLLVPHPADGGMHLAAWLPEGVDDVALAESCAAQGLAVTPLSPHYRRQPARSGLVLGYAGWPPPVLEAAVSRLAPLVEAACGTLSRSVDC